MDALCSLKHTVQKFVTTIHELAYTFFGFFATDERVPNVKIVAADSASVSFKFVNTRN